LKKVKELFINLSSAAVYPVLKVKFAVLPKFSVELVYLAMLLNESTVMLLDVGVVPVEAFTISGDPIFNEGTGFAVVDVFT
jgi:hypothetical protein